jgi:hypothetical protein
MQIHTVHFALIVAAVAEVGIPTARLGAQSTGSAQAPATCMSSIAASDVYAAGERCISTWTDSLRSTVPGTGLQARNALVMIGGRAAVDALRANYEWAPNRASRLTVIAGMATTGSPEDVAFLATQLQGRFTGDSEAWPRIQAAATVLGLLRARAARDSLTAALARNGQSGFAGRAVATALASLDRPPCSGSVDGDLNQALVRIVMQCGPQSMNTEHRYLAEPTDAWSFDEGAWHLGARTPADSGTKTRVSTATTIASDARHAEVAVTTWCGSLCGESWTFRLLFMGDAWRVVSAVMNWVS